MVRSVLVVVLLVVVLLVVSGIGGGARGKHLRDHCLFLMHVFAENFVFGMSLFLRVEGRFGRGGGLGGGRGRAGKGGVALV